MAVKLSIDLEALQDPTVAQALADLMAALGPEASQAVRSATPVTLSVPPAPVVSHPVTVIPTAAPAAPATVTVAQAYVEFVEGLAEKPRMFLELLRHRGRLRIDEAMAALGIDQPKAIGGITGAIGRWAPARGIPVPYAPIRIDGKRAWKWTGVPGLSNAPIDPTTRPPAVPASEAPEPIAAILEIPDSVLPPLPPVRAGRAKASDGPGAFLAEPEPLKPAPKKKAEPARAVPKKAEPAKAVPKQAEPAKAAPAPVVTLPEDPNARFVRFITELPEEAQAFLRLVYERGTLTMPDAVRHFGLARPRSVGKMTEPINRLSQAWGLPMPYESERSEEGWRFWRWRGFD